MKKVLLAVLFFAAGVISAAESNLYPNPEYRGRTAKNGRLFVGNHWFRGKPFMDRVYRGKPVIGVEVSVKVTAKIYDGIVATSRIKGLKPGFYKFSALCKPLSKIEKVYLYVSKNPAGQKKRLASQKLFTGAQLPGRNQWTRVDYVFEVKPGESDFVFGCGTQSLTTGKVLWTDPQLVPVLPVIYLNPDYRSTVSKAGKVFIFDHWYNGKLTVSGSYQDRPAVRVESVFTKSWNASLGNVGLKTLARLEPGYYTFSVWCKPVTKASQYGLFIGRKSNGKRAASIFKKYQNADVPKVGEWTELAVNFEVKKGDSDFNFFYAFWGKEKAVTFFADPKIEKEIE